MFVEVGADDAKTKLPELLRRVARGERFTITQHGRPIADLVPSADSNRENAVKAVEAMRAIRRVQGVSPFNGGFFVS